MNKKVEGFRNIAEKRWEYLEKGDSENGNKCFDELRNCIVEIEQSGNMENLIELLDDSNDGVKLEAALKLVSYCPDKSVQVLESLARKKGILPFVAKQTLKKWKAEEVSG